MYLKSIEMQGFKSFPDKTKLVFDPGHNRTVQNGQLSLESGKGVTVIVGPNGSGKSNIADAMRWVLGEISSKSLRGSKMEDVIFGGADSRRPMGYAEVSVTFDNSSSFCRLDCPYDEVTVTRRYFRGGESEYLINRKAVRLRDIYELFLNTGIGRDGYSIIGQGRISEIISRKSEERRTVFEDASGIAKYRLKKTEAERKLDATRDNMERVKDIFAEIEARVGPLEKEAAKAKKGILLLETKKTADVSLWLFDTQRVGNELETAQSEKNRADFDLKQAQDAIQSMETQVSRLTELITAKREESRLLTEQIKTASDTLHTLDKDYRVTVNNIEHNKDKLAIRQSNLENQNTAMQAEEATLAGHTEKLTTLEAEIGSVQTAFDTAVNEAETQKKIGRDLDDKMAASGEQQREIEAGRTDLNVRLSVLENAKDSGDRQNSGLVDEIESYEAVSRDLQKQIDVRQQVLQNYQDMLTERQTRLSNAEKTLADLNRQYGEQYETVRAEKLKADTLDGRIKNLLSLEENYEGYASSVKFVMDRYKAGAIQSFDGNKCGTVYGPLSQLITVEDAYVTAVETSLGANMGHIVVDDESTAKAAIYTLKNAGAGRATFFPLTSMHAYEPSSDMLAAKKYPGFIAFADSLVSTDPRFSGIVGSLLGRTAVFDDIDHATAMARATRYRVRAVTLDGQQINTGGSFTGGSAAYKNGAVSRGAELRRARVNKTIADKAVEDAETALNGIRSNIAQTQDERDDCREQCELISAVIASEKVEYDALTVKLDTQTAMLTRLRDDYNRVLERKGRYEEDMNAIAAELTASANRLAEIKAYRASLHEKIADVSDELERLASEQTKLYIRLSEIKKDIETHTALSDECRARIAAFKQNIDDTRSQISELETSSADMQAKLTENRRAYTEAEQTLASLNESLERSNTLCADFDTKLTDLHRKISDKHGHLENLLRVFTAAESRVSALEDEKIKLETSLWEAYEMTRADAVNMNCPPVSEQNLASLRATQTECRNKLRALGHFDPGAVDEYLEVKQRYETMAEQIRDLEQTEKQLTSIISKLETDMSESFSSAFDAINKEFATTFTELFGGGTAELTLTDPDNVLESGIEIKAAPPGKIIKNLIQLSGGEQAFVGVALFFAILKVNPTPFCILDEIEAALDEVNVERLAHYIKRYSDDTQFIMITHRRGTMAAATRLYGVTMPEHGISKILALDIADMANDKNRKEGTDWDGLFR